MSPAPLRTHHLGRLSVALLEHCPAELEVLLAPTDYQPTSNRSLQPDCSSAGVRIPARRR